MNNASKRHILPPLIAELLDDPVTYIDNVFADGWKRLRFSSLIEKAGFSKRSGTDVNEVVYLLLIWKWLNVSSISVFTQKAIGLFSYAKKDVMYDMLKREDINWREFNVQSAKQVYKKHGLENAKLKAFVLDDSIKQRRGKHMEGVSLHYDHVSNTNVIGQQVLTLGLSTEDAFLPIDSQISVGEKKAQGLRNNFVDGRSAGAKRYEEAVGKSKVQMAKSMIHRAVRAGIKASHVIADAWFGNKTMIKAALDLNMHAILRMKRGNMKYIVTFNGKRHELDANECYQRLVRKNWRKIDGMPWKAVELAAEIDLSQETGKKAKPDIRKVKLLFVRGIKAEPDLDGSAKDWALFLCTDTELSALSILQNYALRWSIEVYFKEAKQHLGFLKEQTLSFVSHTASIHLCAIRYLLLVDGKLSCNGASVGQIRCQIQKQLDSLNFATSLWQVFRALVSGTLEQLRKKLRCPVNTIMQEIDDAVTQFFVQALQLDDLSLQRERM